MSCWLQDRVNHWGPTESSWSTGMWSMCTGISGLRSHDLLRHVSTFNFQETFFSSPSENKNSSGPASARRLLAAADGSSSLIGQLPGRGGRWSESNDASFLKTRLRVIGNRVWRKIIGVCESGGEEEKFLQWRVAQVSSWRGGWAKRRVGSSELCEVCCPTCVKVSAVTPDLFIPCVSVRGRAKLRSLFCLCVCLHRLDLSVLFVVLRHTDTHTHAHTRTRTHLHCIITTDQRCRNINPTDQLCLYRLNTQELSVYEILIGYSPPLVTWLLLCCFSFREGNESRHERVTGFNLSCSVC